MSNRQPQPIPISSLVHVTGGATDNKNTQRPKPSPPPGGGWVGGSVDFRL